MGLHSICVSPEPGTPSSNGEGNEGHEGDEGHEEEGHRLCADTAATGLCRCDGQDKDWLAEDGPHEEQTRQGPEQENARTRAEEPMDDRCGEGAQGLENHWTRFGEEGHTPVPEGEGVHAVSALILEQTYFK